MFMLMQILFVLLVLGSGYTVIGAKIARSHYTELMRNCNNLRDADRELEIEDWKRQRSDLVHQAHCNLAYSSLSHRGCDCNKSSKWHVLNSNIKAGEAGMFPKPTPKYSTIATWPASLVSSYVTGGADALPDYAYIQLQEAELRKELTS